jgi:hypothetical protein
MQASSFIHRLGISEDFELFSRNHKNNSYINIHSRICLSFALYLFSSGNLDLSTKVHFSRLYFSRLRPVVFFIHFYSIREVKRTHIAQYL